ncbi:aminoglycoside phosphotransferase (APT) family kinase protein [Peribacillus deserti]|uniref:Aminoglycoside phosphotransferase (APT) family kinase protein n=1 Tax=Peribacillus deserti TaxID=673318 RepID=A0ABS2QDT9_9BACI|nr:phosphotransferase family protein [Peribacillus deserti]MBM7691325.1 aminoglycoside phosphotransferase (APT) family kinase protein [Peribacillus deserti]
MPKQADRQTIPVRRSEELNIALLEQFLRERFADLPSGKLEIQQFAAGHSNLTYELKIGEWEAVLRKPPLGPLAPKAHDMSREYQILSEVHPLFPAAPKPLLYWEDKEITGSPFLVMERKHGIVIDSSFPEGISATPELCSRISHEMVNKLAELHSIPYKGTRLEEISRPDGFMERQVHGWIGRYERAKTSDIKGADKLTQWLIKKVPSVHEAALIHYDFKLNNSMFDHNLEKMAGLFDWEMSTIGDPLADLGAAMSYWTEKDDPELLKTGLGKPPVTVQAGFLSRKEFMEAYARKSGRDITNMNFYVTFAYFKLAVIAQQIFYRYKNGQTNDERFARFDSFVKSLITHGANIANDDRQL